MSRRATRGLVLVGLLGCGAGPDRGGAGPVASARGQARARPAPAGTAACEPARLDAAIAGATEHAWVAPRRIWVAAGAGAFELSVVADEDEQGPAPARVVVLRPSTRADGLLEIAARIGATRLRLWVEPGAVEPALARPAALVASPPTAPGPAPGSPGPGLAPRSGVWAAAGTLATGPAVDGWIPVASAELNARGWVRDDRVARWRPTPPPVADGPDYADWPFELLDDAGDVISVVRSRQIRAWVGPDGRVTAVDAGGCWATGRPRPFATPTRSGSPFHFSDYEIDGELADQVSPGSCLHAAPGGPWLGVAGAGVVRTGQRTSGWDQVRLRWAGATLLLYVPAPSDS